MYLSSRGYRAVRSTSLLDSTSCDLIPLRLMLYILPTHSYTMFGARVIWASRSCGGTTDGELDVSPYAFEQVIIVFLRKDVTSFLMVLRICPGLHDVYKLLSHRVGVMVECLFMDRGRE